MDSFLEDRKFFGDLHGRMHWSDDSTLLIGLSPIGRATIERLRLNRSGVVELRMALLATGKHPPAHTL